MTTPSLDEIRELLAFLTPEERSGVDQLLTVGMPIWLPLQGPQMDAYLSEADILFYGGAAGGGKTDLALGLALTAHQHSIIYRREAVQLEGVYQRLANILGSKKGFNGASRIWQLPDGRVAEFGAVKDLGDEKKYQGRPHDLKVFDEITHFAEIQFRFLCGWMRTTKPGQRQRVLCTGNPPTDDEGEWVVKYWAPWLDPDYRGKRAEPGELRWFAVLDGKDVEQEGSAPFWHKGERIVPKSRSFIPSRVRDNPFLVETGYESTLQSLPEPLRSQMLRGNFLAARVDNPWQLIPSAWVDAAQARWRPDGGAGRPMDSVGVDPARGGTDCTVLGHRRGNWFSEQKTFPGAQTSDGGSVAALAVAEARDGAPIHVDVIGIGSSVYDHLSSNGIHVEPVNASEGTDERDRTGQLSFCNMRSLIWWRMREALDPEQGEGLALPPDPELKADLCAPRWKMLTRGVQVESKDDIKGRIGRSPDKGDAAVYTLIATAKRNAGTGTRRSRSNDWRAM